VRKKEESYRAGFMQLAAAELAVSWRFVLFRAVLRIELCRLLKYCRGLERLR